MSRWSDIRDAARRTAGQAAKTLKQAAFGLACAAAIGGFGAAEIIAIQDMADDMRSLSARISAVEAARGDGALTDAIAASQVKAARFDAMAFSFGVGLAALVATIVIAALVAARRRARLTAALERLSREPAVRNARARMAAMGWFSRRSDDPVVDLAAITNAYRTISNALNASRSGVIIFDPAGRVTLKNKALRAIEERYADALGAELAPFTQEEPETAFFRYLQDRILNHPDADQRNRVRQFRITGENFVIEASIRIALDGGGKAGYFAELYDVSEEVTLEGRISTLIDEFKRGQLYSRIDVDVNHERIRTGFLYQVSRDLNTLLDVIAELFADIDSAVMAMVAGDVTFKLSGDYEGEFDNLKNSLNQSMETFEETIQKITDVARDVAAATDGVASLSQQLEGEVGTQQQAVASTTATLKDIAASVRANAESAETAVTLSQETSRRAARGRELVVETNAAMEAIKDGASQIGEVTQLIEEIAFQTNLLALNAAVEAARAGAAGKGFAVVALEVRALATRSADAAKRIDALIRESLSRVAAGATLFGQTAEALTEIEEAVNKTSDHVSSITEATRSQAVGAEDAARAVVGLGDGAGRNLAIAGDNNRNAADLKEQVEKLRELVGFFIINSTVAAAADEGGAPSAELDAEALAAEWLAMEGGDTADIDAQMAAQSAAMEA